MDEVTVQITDGPYVVKGPVDMTGPDGTPVETGKSIALCRCGASSNKPFCDGTHKKIDFDGTLAADGAGS